MGTFSSQTTKVNGKGHGTSVKGWIFCILQTHVGMWFHVWSWLLERDPTSLQHELITWNAHKKASDVNIFVCHFKGWTCLVEIVK